VDDLNKMKRQAVLLDRRRFLRLTAGAGAGLALAACGGNGGAGGDPTTAAGAATGAATAVAGGATYDGPALTLNFWNGFTGADGPLLRELVERFSAEHDNIDVAMNVMDWGDYYSTVAQAKDTADGPDIGIMHIDQLAINAARSIIAPLDPIVSTLDLAPDDFVPAVWEAGIWQDQRYGIPLDVHPLGFYYNKDLMEQVGLDPETPPTNNDEFMAALDAFKAEGIEGHWISPFLFTGGLEFQSLLPQFGGSMFDVEDQTATATWGSDAGVEAVEWMLGLIDAGHSPTDVAQDAEHIAFQNGDNAFIINGIWMILGYGDTQGLNFGVAPMPQIGPEQQAVWASSHNFVVFNPREGLDENTQQAATVFINWISENSLAWAEAGQIPARTSVRESAEFQELEHQATLAEQMDYVQFLPPLPGISEAMGEFESGFNAAILEGNPGALQDSADRATRLLAQAAERFGG